MNPLFSKQTRLHRSISAKVNPEQEKHKLFKSTQQSLDFQRQFNLRAKVIDALSTQQLLNAKIQQNRESFMKNITPDLFPRQGSMSARQQLKSKLNPCNPFESLTQSSIKRNPQNEKAMELILAHRKINQLEISVHSLTKEINIVKQQKFQVQKQHNNHLSTIKAEVNELNKQKLLLENKNNELMKNVQVLMLENQELKVQIENLNSKKDHLSKTNQQSSTNDPEQKAQKFKQLGQDFERKIKDLYQENYKLRNKVSWYEGKLQQSQTIIKSLKSLNELLEKRFSQQQEQGNGLKQKFQKQNQKLREGNLALRQQRQTMKSQHEMQVIKLENEVEELRQEVKGMVKKEKEEQVGIESNALNSLSGYKKIMKQQDMIELLQLAVKEQVEEILRLKEKNKKLTKMVK